MLGKIFLIIFYFLHFVTSVTQSQSFIVPVNRIRYIGKIPDGSDITQKLKTVLSQCNANDVIILPRGKFTLTGEIEFYEKQISIIGQGCDTINGTVIYRKGIAPEYSYMLALNDLGSASSKTIISGIYFKSYKSSRFGGGSSLSYESCLKFNRVKNFIISDNIFQYFSVSGIYVSHDDSITDFNGLIFNNSFLDLYRDDIHNYGYGVVVGGNAKKWLSQPEFGTSRFIFIEENYFRETRHAVAGASSAKYVFRHNVIDDNWVTCPVDMHGAGAFNNVLSARAAEIYGNSIQTKFDSYGRQISSSTPWYRYIDAIGIRGGEALIYDNVIYNYKTIGTFSLEQPNPSGYPSLSQIGYLSGKKYGFNDSGYSGDHGNGDIFAWANHREKKFPEWSDYAISIEDTGNLRFGRDIHVDIQKPAYQAYPFPHDYRNYYYSFVKQFLDKLSDLKITEVNERDLSLTWNDVLCEDGYYLYQSNDGINFSIIDTLGMNDTSIVVNGINVEKEYWYYVTAFNDHVLGAQSKIKSSQSNDLDIYPNPSEGKFSILIKEVIDECLINILDIRGIIIYTKLFSGGDSELMEEVDISFAPPGIYLMMLKTGDMIYKKKLLVN